MSKRAIRWCRTVLVGALVVFMTFDSALACRWRARRSGCAAPSCSAEGAVASQSPIQKGAAPLHDEPPAVTAPPQASEAGPAVIVEPSTPAAEESASDKTAPPKPDPTPPEAPKPDPVQPEPPKADPPPVEPTKIEPAEPTAKPVKPDDFDDLFPPATPKPAVPVDPPADAPPADPTTPATPPAEVKPAVPAPSPTEDDPFAPAPAATPAPPTPATPAPAATPKLPAVDDDPFAPATPPSAPKPATPAAPAVDDDPFKISAEGTLAIREWIDNSGSFRIRGRLIAVLDGKVRILKESGRTTTVPMERLSPADREYVNELVTRYGSELDSRLASR